MYNVFEAMQTKLFLLFVSADEEMRYVVNEMKLLSLFLDQVMDVKVVQVVSLESQMKYLFLSFYLILIDDVNISHTRAVLATNEFVVVVVVVVVIAAFDLTIGDVRRPVNGVCARGMFGVVGILS